LPKPEVVPFRLTQNMLDAFGPTGADGLYAQSLQVAMGTLRNNRDTLLSVLEPFINDPVIDWMKRNKSSGRQKDNNQLKQDRQAKEAKRSIKVIDERLQGIFNLHNPNHRRVHRIDGSAAGNHLYGGYADEDGVMSTHYVRLSVEGQVHKLIAEATSSENLVQLYVGWMPWL